MYKTARPKTRDWEWLWRQFRRKQISRSFSYCELKNSPRKVQKCVVYKKIRKCLRNLWLWLYHVGSWAVPTPERQMEKGAWCPTLLPKFFAPRLWCCTPTNVTLGTDWAIWRVDSGHPATAQKTHNKQALRDEHANDSPEYCLCHIL